MVVDQKQRLLLKEKNRRMNLWRMTSSTGNDAANIALGEASPKKYSHKDFNFERMVGGRLLLL